MYIHSDILVLQHVVISRHFVVWHHMFDINDIFAVCSTFCWHTFTPKINKRDVNWFVRKTILIVFWTILVPSDLSIKPQAPSRTIFGSLFQTLTLKVLICTKYARIVNFITCNWCNTCTSVTTGCFFKMSKSEWVMSTDIIELMGQKLGTWFGFGWPFWFLDQNLANRNNKHQLFPKTRLFEYHLNTTLRLL